MARLVKENPGILDALFTRRETEYCVGRRRCHEHLAGRFVAKEAVLKALGTGLGRGMQWTDVEIVHDAAGRPRVWLHGIVADWARRHGVVDLDVSLSHTADLAIAHAVVLWEGQPVMRPPGAGSATSGIEAAGRPEV